MQEPAKFASAFGNQENASKVHWALLFRCSPRVVKSFSSGQLFTSPQLKIISTHMCVFSARTAGLQKEKLLADIR